MMNFSRIKKRVVGKVQKGSDLYRRLEENIQGE